VPQIKPPPPPPPPEGRKPEGRPADTETIFHIPLPNSFDDFVNNLKDTAHQGWSGFAGGIGNTIQGIGDVSGIVDRQAPWLKALDDQAFGKPPEEVVKPWARYFFDQERENKLQKPNLGQRVVGGAGEALPGAAASAVNLPLGVTLAFAQGAHKAQADARAHGASQAQADQSALLNGALQGVLAVAPKPFAEGLESWLAKTGESTIARRLGTTFVAEGGSGAAGQVGENVLASGYDPGRHWDDKVVETGLAAGTLGAVAHGKEIRRGSEPSLRPSPPTMSSPSRSTPVWNLLPAGGRNLQTLRDMKVSDDEISRWLRASASPEGLDRAQREILSRYGEAARREFLALRGAAIVANPPPRR
jgi:hypothetical protein